MASCAGNNLSANFFESRIVLVSSNELAVPAINGILRITNSLASAAILQFPDGPCRYDKYTGQPNDQPNQTSNRMAFESD